MDTPIHPNLTHLATLSHRSRQRNEARISWAYISDTPADVVCGLCGEHEHPCADTRFWRCPMAACGHSPWHDSCLDGMFEREAAAGRALAFGCPACGTGWWLRSEMSAEGAQLREAWQEMQMLMLLREVEEMEGWSGLGLQLGGLEGGQELNGQELGGQQQEQGIQQLALEQERQLSHLYQEYKVKKQLRQQQALAEEGHLHEVYQQYLLKEQQQQQQQQGSEQQHRTDQLYQQYQQGLEQQDLEQQDLERQYRTHQLYHLKQQQQQQLQQSLMPLLQPDIMGEDT